MTCPSCNQSASTFMQHAFSLQGVSISQSMRRYFKCQHCGTLLRITSFGNQFWFFFTGAAFLLVLFMLVYRRLFLLIGPGATAAIWMILLLLIVTSFAFGSWKFAQVQKIEAENHSTAK